MTTLTGHLSLYATQSLKSIDNWMNVVQSNIGGSLVTAYKQVELNYAGGLTHEIRSTTNLKNGVMIGEQTLTTGNTRVNWKQGEVISSTQETHFAIQGDGFFLVVDPKQTAVTSGFFTGKENGVYLTRQGDFHFAEVKNAAGGVIGGAGNLVLVNKEGMLVMADYAGGGFMQPSGAGNSDNIYDPITKTNFEGTDKLRPSVVQPSYDTPQDGAAPVTIVDYDELKYSRYGSGIFQSSTSNSIKTVVSGSLGNFDARNITGVKSDTRLINNALEASNVRVERNITELAVMGKIYNGFVQLIKVYNSNLDEVLAFIR